MRVKHICDLYDWKRIRMLRNVWQVNRHHGFVPVAVYAPNGGDNLHCCGNDGHHEHCGRVGPHYAKRLWEEARRRLEGREAEALAFDVVEASECFNTIRFRNRSEACAYSAEFWRLLREIADSGESVRICNPVPSSTWKDVEKFFVDLSEDDLAFLNGAEYVNRKPSELDAELLDACARLDAERVESLLSAGASPNAVSESSFYDTAASCALEAAFSVHAESSAAEDISRRVIDVLVAHGCDLDFCAYDSCTVLFNAIHCSAEIVQYLLEKGADPNAVSWVGTGAEPSTALEQAEDEMVAYYDPFGSERMCDLLGKAGGKRFFEMVTDFYGE